MLVFSLATMACSSSSNADGDAGPIAPATDSAVTPSDGGAALDAGGAALDASGADASASDASPGADSSAPADAAGPPSVGTATVTFTSPSATNVNTATYSSPSTTSASATKSQTEVTLVTGQGVRTTVFFINSPYAAGQTYTLGSPYDNTTDQATLSYTEKTGQWYATGGTITIESVGTKSFIFHVKDASMVPGPQEKVATGTFTLKVDGPTAVN